MEEGATRVRRWEDLPTDMLVQIFMSFDIFELTSHINHVCDAWHLACCDPILWKTFDLSMVKSNFIRTQSEPYVHVHQDSDKKLTDLLEISLNLSQRCIRTLVFHFNLYLSEEQFTDTAERCPELRRLVMPAWNRITETGIRNAIRAWRYLESLTMPSIANPSYLFQAIAQNCKNFCELKVMGPFDVDFASSLVTSLPELKVLSLRCTMIEMDALKLLLNRLQKLKVLNISHSLLVEGSLHPLAAPKKFMKLDKTILEKAGRLREFLTCMEDSCIMCQRTRSDEGLMRWYRYEVGLWKMDEARSLSLIKTAAETEI